MGNNKYKNWFYGIAVVLRLGFLFGYPIVTDPNRPIIKAWNEAGIGCLNSMVNVAKHEHANLIISVDGVNESFDRDLGIAGGCMGEFHIHAGQPGVLHLETISPTEVFKLSHFSLIYGKPLIREGYILEVTVNGEVVADPANLTLADNQQIRLIYASIKP